MDKFKFPERMPKWTLAVKREKGILSFNVHDHPEQRGDKVRWLIEETCKHRSVPRDFPTLIFDFNDKPETVSEYPVYSFSTTCKEYNKTYPDFLYKDWQYAGIGDYEEFRVRMMGSGMRESSTEAMGWIGATTASVRKRFIRMAREVGKDTLFYRNIVWTRTAEKAITPKYMSMVDQVKAFKYLIDMEGHGYSARTKLQFFAYRPLFIVDRPWEEFFYEHLVPWEHYVPVKRDLSDLLENLEKVRSDISLEFKLIQGAWEFGQTHLTRDSALDRYAEIFQSHQLLEHDAPPSS